MPYPLTDDRTYWVGVPRTSGEVQQASRLAKVAEDHNQQLRKKKQEDESFQGYLATLGNKESADLSPGRGFSDSNLQGKKGAENLTADQRLALANAGPLKQAILGAIKLRTETQNTGDTYVDDDITWNPVLSIFGRKFVGRAERQSGALRKRVLQDYLTTLRVPESDQPKYLGAKPSSLGSKEFYGGGK